MLCVEGWVCVLCEWVATCAMVLMWKPVYRCLWTYSLDLSFHGFWILNLSHWAFTAIFFSAEPSQIPVFFTALTKALKN